MVVYYSHVPSIFSIPSKAYPPLVIDTNAVLTVPVPRKGFEMVPWGIPQVHQAFRIVQKPELFHSPVLHGFGEFPDPATLGYSFGVPVAVIPDHSRIISSGTVGTT
jgi:hypothetical protein